MLQLSFISSLTCTGWIKYFVTHPRPDYVIDSYSSSGKLYQAKKDCKLSYYDSLNTEELQEQLSEAEKLTVLNSVTKIK